MKERNFETFRQALQILDKQLEIINHPKIVIRAIGKYELS